MYEFKKKNGKILTSKSVGTGPSSYEKGIYRAAVSQRLRNTALGKCPTKIHKVTVESAAAIGSYLCWAKPNVRSW